MEGGKKPARDQNEITARERDGWWCSRGEREGGVQQSRVCRGPTHGCSPGTAVAPDTSMGP